MKLIAWQTSFLTRPGAGKLWINTRWLGSVTLSCPRRTTAAVYAPPPIWMEYIMGLIIVIMREDGLIHFFHSISVEVKRKDSVRPWTRLVNSKFPLQKPLHSRCITITLHFKMHPLSSSFLSWDILHLLLDLLHRRSFTTVVFIHCLLRTARSMQTLAYLPELRPPDWVEVVWTP